MPPALWPSNSPDHNLIDYTMFRSESIVPRSRTSTNWNDTSTVSGPLWVTPLLNMLLASGVSLRSWWRRTFCGHGVINMMWCDTCYNNWQIWLSLFSQSFKCTLNYCNVCSGLSSNLYWNGLIIFGRWGAKDKLAQFFRHGVHSLLACLVQNCFDSVLYICCM